MNAADMYRFVGDTHLTELPPEVYDEFPTLAELIEILSETLNRSRGWYLSCRITPMSSTFWV